MASGTNLSLYLNNNNPNTVDDVHLKIPITRVHGSENNPAIKRAVDALRNRTFAQTDEEHQAFSDLYHKLIEAHYGGAPDRYFTLKDLQSYYETEKKAEELYRNRRLWAEYAIHNIAGMGKFSSDYSIHNYAKLIWGIEPCQLDQDLLDKVRYDYAINNRCY